MSEVNPTRILALAGSTRTNSFNRSLLAAAVKIARGHGADITEINLGEYALPLVDQDLEVREGLPENAKACPEFCVTGETRFQTGSLPSI